MDSVINPQTKPFQRMSKPLKAYESVQKGAQQPLPRPPETLDCLACQAGGNRKDCDHEECRELDGCLFDDCLECEGNGWIVP